MNQYFNVTRFGRLARKHFSEHATKYALGATMLLAGMLAIMGFLSYMGRGLGHSGQATLFLLFMLAAGSFFTSTVLAEYGHGSGAGQALMLPASHLEKFVLAWLVAVPGFLVVFTGLFYLAVWLVLALGGRGEPVANLLESPEQVWYLLRLFGMLHAVALWGSIFFSRQQFIRTVFVVFVLAVGVFVVNYQALRLLIGPVIQVAAPWANVNLGNGLQLRLPESQAGWLGWLPVALVALLWPAAYFRLTEKQL